MRAITKDIEKMAMVLEENLYKNQGGAILEGINKKNVENLSTSKEKIREIMEEELSTYCNADGSEISSEDKSEMRTSIDKSTYGV